MKKYLFAEIICIIITLVFIISSVSNSFVTDKTADEISVNLIELMGEDVKIRNNAFATEKFDLDLSVFDSYIYASSDDVMNVNELFIGVFSDGADSDVKDVFCSYAEDRYNLFNGYAPEQAALLDDYILEEKSGAIIFCVSENADAVLGLFSDSL